MFLLVRETEDDFWPLNLDSLYDKSVLISFRALEYHQLSMQNLFLVISVFNFFERGSANDLAISAIEVRSGVRIPLNLSS